MPTVLPQTPLPAPLLLRLAFSVDARLVMAVIGLGAAMLVPVAGVLASEGIAVRIDPATPWLATFDSHAGKLPARFASQLTWALSETTLNDTTYVAFTTGPPRIAPGEAFDGGASGRPVQVAGLMLTTRSVADAPVATGMVLVHPDDLVRIGVAANAPPWIRAALYSSQPVVPGATVLPARGADAFETRGIADLRQGTWALVAITIPLVALVAAAFAALEATRWSLLSGLGAALGHPKAGRTVVIVRAWYLGTLAAVTCVALALGAWSLGALPGGGGVVPWPSLLGAVLAPLLAAGLAGTVAAWRLGRSPLANLARRPTMGDERARSSLPLLLRPWVAGFRLLGVLAVVAFVIGLDVGMPLAAAATPAALAGEHGEWVVGAVAGRINAGRVASAPADVMALDPAVADIVAETFVPTVVKGEPVLLRGGAWDGLARYHGLNLVQGVAPGTGQAVIGTALAKHLGLHTGDALWVAGEGGRLARLVVSGTFTGSRLLDDEAIIPAADAALLANLPPGIAHVLRLRPDTQEALATLQRSSASIQLGRLTIVPDQAPAGSIAVARVEGVNLSGTPGARVLQVRVDGLSVATAALPMPAYGRGSIDVPFRVPAGPFHVSINPEADAVGTVPQASLLVQGAAAVGSNVTAHVTGLPTVRVNLYPDLAAAHAGLDWLATDVTDAAGDVRLHVGQAGPLVIATVGDTVVTAPLFGYTPENGTAAHFVVEAVYTVPEAPAVGSLASFAARIRNAGGAPADHTVVFAVDGHTVDLVGIRLGPGEVATATTRYVAATGDDVLSVDGVPLHAASTVQGVGDPLPLPEARTGAGLQAAVADTLLGNSRAVLSGLALTAATSSLVLLHFGTRRLVGQRAGVVAVLGTMWSREQVQGRAALEGAVLGVLGGLVGLLAAKLVLTAISLTPSVRPFGHALPDPMGYFLILQIVSLVAFLAAATLHATAGKALDAKMR